MKRPSLLMSACQAALVLGASYGVVGSARAQSNTAADTTVTVIAKPITTAPPIVPLTAQYSESTITSDVVENLSPQESLQTMLQNQPSIFTYQNGPNGVGASIFFRAFNAGQFAETFDGIEINDIFNGAVTGEAATFNSVLFIPANVDSVVLNRGINNPAVNSYNSLGGTINFLPRLPSATPGGQLSASYGSFNSWDVRGSYDFGDFHGLKQVLQFDYSSSDGWQANTADNNANAYYSALYDMPNGNQLSFVAVYDHNGGHNPLEMPTPLLQQNGKYYQYPLDVANETATDTEGLGIVGYKAQLSPIVTFETKVFGGVQDFNRESYANPVDYNSPYSLPNQGTSSNYWIYNPYGPFYNPKSVFGSNIAGTDYHFYGYQNWAVGDTSSLKIALPDNLVTIGGNVTYGKLHSREYYYGSEPVPQRLQYNDAWDEHDDRLLASIYGQDDIKLFADRLTVTPGVKFVYAHTRDQDNIGFFYPYGGSVSDDESFVSPTLGANFKITDNLAVNAAFGQNIKFPDISAYYNAVPGTTSSTPLTPAPQHIKPEHVNDYELGARYQLGGLAIAADLYREDFSSVFIDTFNSSTYTTTVTNGGSARYQGWELQVSDEFSIGPYGTLKPSFSYAHNESYFTSSFNADSYGGGLSSAQVQVNPGEPMADVPKELITAGVTWAWRQFRFDAEGREIGRQFILDDDTGTPASTTIPSHFLLDLGGSYTIPLSEYNSWAKSVKLSIRANNVTNKYYFNDAYVSSSGTAGPTEFANPAAPASVYGRIEVNF